MASAPVEQHQGSNDREIGKVEGDPGTESRSIEPGLVIDDPGKPAARRHATAAAEEQRRNAPGRLGGREKFPQRQYVSGDNPAEAQAKKGRDRKEAGLVL